MTRAGPEIGAAGRTLAFALSIIACGGGRPPATGTTPASAPPGPPPAVDDLGDQALPFAEQLDDRRWVIDRDLVAMVLADGIGGAIGVEPGPGGLRLRAHAPSPALRALGLRDGDRLVRLGDRPATSAAALRRAYADLRDAGDLWITVGRDGETSTRHYFLRESIEDPPLPRPPPSDQPLPPWPALFERMATGARRVSTTRFEIDRQVVTLLARSPDLLMRELVSPPGVVGARPMHDARLLRALGLTSYDLLQAFDGKVLEDTVQLLGMLQPFAAGTSTGFQLTLLRIRDRIEIDYRIVDGLVDARALADAVAAAEQWEHEQAAERAAADAADATASAPAISMAGIRRIDDVTYEIDQATAAQILADPNAASKGARFVPAIRNGKPTGIKLYAIRPRSVFGALGLMNGDTIAAINGMALDSVERTLEVYQRLRGARLLRLDLVRRGKPVRLTWKVR